MEINQAEIYYELHENELQAEDPNHSANHSTHTPALPSLILIEGYGCDHSMWLPLLEPLKKHFKILILDHRGSGQTQDNQQGNQKSPSFSLETLADDIMMLAAKLELKHPHIVGHSMGGAIAQIIASKYPDKFNKLILMNSSQKFNTISYFVLLSLLKMQKQNVDLSLILDVFLPWGNSEDFLSNPDNVEAQKKWVLEYPFPQTIEGNERQLKAIQAFDGSLLLSSIKAPTLVVGSSQDRLVTFEESEALHQGIKNSKLMKVSGGHLWVDERPEESARIILEFL